MTKCEDALTEAEGLAAHLDDDDQGIVERIVQSVANFKDLADELASRELQAQDLKKAHEALWSKEKVQELGKAISDLRDRSLFHDRDLKDFKRMFPIRNPEREFPVPEVQDRMPDR